MKEIEIEKSLFSTGVRERNLQWVKPKLVGQVGFTEWTDDNKLRHPRFLSLRRDKKPETVEKES